MKLENIYISALFHDIGKFIERTKKYKDLPNNSKWTKEKTRYIHPIYSAEWFRIAAKHMPYFKGIPGEELEEIETLIATHHAPTSLEGKLIQLADWLSSSEREEEEEKKRNTSSYNKTPLSPIFVRLDEKDKKDNYSYPSKPLDFDTIFPVNQKEVDFGKLEEEFENAIRDVDVLEKFIPLLEMYTWPIPAQTVGFIPDISLYDHLITTGAFATALYYEVQNGSLTEKDINGIISKKKTDMPCFYLVGGNISGIQSFIFNIPSDGAAKSLKGRSLYISILTEIVSRYIIKRLGLPNANIIYRGGGNFHILIPYSSGAQIEKIREEITSLIFKAHKEHLYLSLEQVPITPKDIMEHNLHTIYKRLNKALSDRKNKRYTEIFNQYDFLFSQPKGLSSYEDHCKVCGENRETHMKEKDLCKMCASFIELAEEVKRARYLSIQEPNPSNEEIYTYKDLFSQLGYKIDFTKEPIQNAKNYNLFEFSLNTDGYRLGAYKVPSDTFEEIAEMGEDGAKLLGYLKLDVDNLGALFSGKNKKEPLSISRRATLSRMLKLFFTAYIPNKLQDEKDIYLLYSGGDDTFIIGRWERVVEVALSLREDFRRFVAETDITFSSGITLLKPGFPVIRAASIVEEELDNAKANPDKDSVSIFGEAFLWEEFNDLWAFSDKLCSWAYELKKKSFIHKIETLSYGFKLINKKYDIGKPWQFVYALRDLDKEKLNTILKIVKAMWLQEGRKEVEIGGDKYHINNPAFLNIASRIAELKLREVKFNV